MRVLFKVALSECLAMSRKQMCYGTVLEPLKFSTVIMKRFSGNGDRMRP